VSHNTAAAAGGVTILGVTIGQGWLVGGITAAVVLAAFLVRRRFRRGRGVDQ
jgi:hypothetical protein